MNFCNISIEYKDFGKPSTYFLAYGGLFIESMEVGKKTVISFREFC